ncbi:MAG: hypothetical protein FJY51_06235 [Betaproteobacteria bacterium]|nr:hypothetical protein [Betaproteobacteria bacterium]
MSSKVKAPRASKPVWERAYKGHVLWQGKKRLGRVSLAGDGRYTWEAAGRGGSANELAKARKAVEAAVAMADKQLDLFG